MDSGWGCPVLLKELVERVKPKFHCCGHMHEDYGVKVLGNTVFINAASVNDDKKIAHRPIVFDIEIPSIQKMKTQAHVVEPEVPPVHSPYEIV
jgi:Icc-related predicted phosphoesterase